MSKSYGEGYIIVDSETDEQWYSEVYYSPSGAKTSWSATKRCYDREKRSWIKSKFNEQDKYKVVKVKFVPVDEIEGKYGTED